ncbi:hypothetical protein H5410_040001 [Solanum commersonii]|uniref:Uncharacterized protein n=1 Tax=Solanum commersonii TaxID=4109 RepID=A0A9J5XPQ9_SOLCO|nr:hypothetical protein H5410_040001 [Solanum commersonii]
MILISTQESIGYLKATVVRDQQQHSISSASQLQSSLFSSSAYMLRQIQDLNLMKVFVFEKKYDAGFMDWLVMWSSLPNFWLIVNGGAKNFNKGVQNLRSNHTN